MTERLHFHFSLSCIGEGNGNPLQCSCLENPRDGGAWWAAVHGVAQKRLSSSSSEFILTSLLIPLLSTALTINLKGFKFLTLIVLTKKLVTEELKRTFWTTQYFIWCSQLYYGARAIAYECLHITVLQPLLWFRNSLNSCGDPQRSSHLYSLLVLGVVSAPNSNPVKYAHILQPWPSMPSLT